MTARLSYSILGPVTVLREGEPVHLGGAKPKAILAALLMNPGRVVSSDALIDVLWDDPPDRAHQTLQVHISNLRKQLGDAQPGIQTRMPGYLISAGADDLDSAAFERLVGQAGQARSGSQPARAADLLREALALWRGEGLDDIEGSDFAHRSRRRLSGLRVAAAEELAAVQLESGNPGQALRTVEEQMALVPLRESLWELKMTALYRAGRQADAITAYHECRDLLEDRLGIDPSAGLQTLYERILRQDAALNQKDVASIHLTRTVTASRIEATLESPVGSFPLQDVTVIGRHPDCEITLDDPQVSRRHAEIRVALGSHLIIDLGSSNGTRVNGALVASHLLTSGDRVEIGDTVLTYRPREIPESASA